jgi:hypothetical protein
VPQKASTYTWQMDSAFRKSSADNACQGAADGDWANWRTVAKEDPWIRDSGPSVEQIVRERLARFFEQRNRTVAAAFGLAHMNLTRSPFNISELEAQNLATAQACRSDQKY